MAQKTKTAEKPKAKGKALAASGGKSAPVPVKPNPPGRPSKFTPDRVKRMLEAAAASISEELIARYGGIDYSTLRDWLLRGERAAALLDAGEDVEPVERAYAEFSEAYKRTRDEAELLAVTEIKAAGKKSWTALAWWLERRNQRVYGRPGRIPEGEGGGELLPGAPGSGKGLQPGDRVRRLERLAAVLTGPNGEKVKGLLVERETVEERDRLPADALDYAAMGNR